MSRSKLVRALLAIASLLGAVPLMAQVAARTASVSAPAAATATFPYGRYSSPPPADQPDGAILVIEFTPGSVLVRSAARPDKSYGMSVTGDTWIVWQTTGGCAEPEMIMGAYKWSYVGGVLSFTPVDDKCPGRAEKMGSVRLTRMGAAPAAAAAPVPAAPAQPSSSTVFPVGRYVIQPLEGANQNGAGLIIEMSTTTAKVFNGENLLETHGVTITGDTWHIFEFEGECLDEGSYHWHAVGGVLTFEMISDPCAQRAQSVSTVRLVKMP